MHVTLPVVYIVYQQFIGAQKERKEHHRVELQNQQALFDEQKALFNEQLAEAAADASNRQHNFDSQMARAALDASDMIEAFERLSHDYDDLDDRKKAELVAAKVRAQFMQGNCDITHSFTNQSNCIYFRIFQITFLTFIYMFVFAHAL